MSEYANPTEIHRNSRFNQYRAQASGGIESFDFKGFYTRPEEAENNRQRAILGLEENMTELELKEKDKELEITVKTETKAQDSKKTKELPRAYAFFGGLG